MAAKLAAARSDGESFPVAWRTSWAAIRWPCDTERRRGWKDALNFGKHEWQAAYEGRPTETAATLAGLRETVPDETWQTLEAAAGEPLAA